MSKNEQTLMSEADNKYVDVTTNEDGISIGREINQGI